MTSDSHDVRFILCLFLLATAARAGSVEFVSGVNRTHLLELFTSEGCSSCPPAEAWLTSLRDDPRLWREFVPVAWHVDYWDNLGWKDNFASKVATRREYAYGADWRAQNVYTPCVAIDGTESRSRMLPASTAAAGILVVVCADQRAQIRFEPVESGKFEVHAVLLGLGITSAVKAGENRGRQLRHDFVATGPLHSVPLEANAAMIELGPVPADGAPQHALAVWITRRNTLAPVQAVGGILPP